MLSSIRSGSVALTLLDQTSAAAAGARDGSDRIGPLGQAAKPGGAPPGAAASTALFSVDQTSPDKELVKMPRRIGQVFGIARDTYATQANDMTAVGAAFTRLLEKPNDATLIEAIAGRLHVDGDAVAVPTRQNSPALLVGLIERFLGLDRLGVALTGVIAAGRDPDAGAAVKVRAAFLNRPDARPDAVTWAALGVRRPGPTGGRTAA